jgi:HlyD family secretion protein
MSQNPAENHSELSDRSNSRPASGWSGKVWLVLILVGLCLGAWAATPLLKSQFAESSEEKFAHLITEQARKGPLLVTVNVQGNLDSQNNAILSSQVEGTTTIISIVPEGSWVEEGDVVCVLDSSLLEDEAKTQEITVTNADAAEAQAKEQLEVALKQGESDIATAELALVLAELDLEKYQEGEYSKLENELKGNLELAKQEAIQSEETYEFTKRLVKKGYKNQNELEAARIQVQKTELAVQKAAEELKVLQDYERKRTLAELKANATEFVRQAERVELMAKAAGIQAEQAYLAASKSAELEREKLVKLQAQIANCTLVAPQAGEVVYANLSSNRRGSDGPAIEEGAEVGQRQDIINLPDVTKMKVDARVHESLVGSLRAGLPAKVRVDAYPDQYFKARVASVSSVPISGSWPNYDLREYEVVIHLTDTEEKVKQLRPGLTAQIEVLVSSRQDILQVPVQTVIGIGGKYFAFVLKASGPERRELSIGESNQTDIEVLDGVAEGEAVVMNPRTNFAEEIAELAAMLGAERDAAMSEEGSQFGTPVPAGDGGPDAPRQNPPAPAGAGGGPTAGGPAKGGPGGEEGRQPGGRRGGNPAQMFARLDADKDGKLTQSELPAGLAGRFSEIDGDSDGSATPAEITAWSEKNRTADGGGAGAARSAGPDAG